MAEEQNYQPFKQVYLFDKDTGEYRGPYSAQLSPLDKPGTYIMPVCSTEVAPPAVDINQIQTFAAGVWSVQPDFRGNIWFDASTGGPVMITSIGQPPSNLVQTYTPPAPTFAEMQAQETARLNATADQGLRAVLIAKGIIAQEDIDTHTDLLIATQVNSLVTQQGSS